MKALARLGAVGRLAELERERQVIFAMFPDLRQAVSAVARRRRGPVAGATAPSADVPAAKPRRRRRMSAEARKRISDAQKKRWAAQKAKKAAR